MLIGLALAAIQAPHANATTVKEKTHLGDSSIVQILRFHGSRAKFEIRAKLAEDIAIYRVRLAVERKGRKRWSAVGRRNSLRVEQAPQPTIDAALSLRLGRRQAQGIRDGRFRIVGSSSLPSELRLRL